MAKHGFPARGGRNPGPVDKRRLMTHMLKVTALQFCHPVMLFIQVIINYCLLHRHPSLIAEAGLSLSIIKQEHN
jgi:hypothetical protein